MDIVANMPVDDRADLFRNTGAQMGLESALIEKDFWVCWILAHLFDIESVRDGCPGISGGAITGHIIAIGGNIVGTVGYSCCCKH